MIYKVTSSYKWTNGDQEKSISFDLARPELTGLAIYKIDGLGPVGANINTSGKVGDGERYNSSFVPKRNIVIYFKPMDIPGELFNDYRTGDYVEENRHRIYEYFPYKKELKLEFETATRHCYIYGYVEKIEPDIFSNQESISVSLICPDPYFYSTDDTTINYNQNGNIFTIPDVLNGVPFNDPAYDASSDISNQSWDIANIPKVPLSYIDIENTMEIYYDGDIPSDIYIVITLSDNPGKIYITNNRNVNDEFLLLDGRRINEYLAALEKSPITSGDMIIINTIGNYDYIYLKRNSDVINILSSVDFNEVDGKIGFPKIYPGINIFKIELEYQTAMNKQMFYPIMYGGI